MSVRIVQGDCRDVLRAMDENSVQCVVTSPPYFGLRDYGLGKGALGLEPSPAIYIENMVALFREVRRVLRKDGVMWLNVGDSYAGGGRGGNPTRESSTLEGSNATQEQSIIKRGSQPAPSSFKAKQRLMMPARLALALQDDGWWLRDEIVWHKTNPMPSSTRDRTTPAHEMVYLFSKRPRYYFDADAIAEPFSESSIARLTQATIADPVGGEKQDQYDLEGYNRGSRRPSEIVKSLSQKITRQPAGWDLGDGAHDTIRHNRGSKRNSFARETKDAGGPTAQKLQHRPGRPDVDYGRSGNKARVEASEHGSIRGNVAGSVPWEGTTRNKRSVWTIATEPYADAHFATFPTKLVEPMILAGTSAKGACARCGAPWARATKKSYANPGNRTTNGPRSVERKHLEHGTAGYAQRLEKIVETTGWEPTCKCEGAETMPCTVLDPFGGSGTVGLVADRLGRDCTLIELNASYVTLARARLDADAGMFASVVHEASQTASITPEHTETSSQNDKRSAATS